MHDSTIHARAQTAFMDSAEGVLARRGRARHALSLLSEQSRDPKTPQQERRHAALLRRAVRMAEQQIVEENRRREAEARQAGIEARRRFARTYENEMLSKGIDAVIRAEGTESRTLRFRYVLMGRPMAYQLVNDPGWVSGVQALGFRRVILTDGYDWTWTFNVPQ